MVGLLGLLSVSVVTHRIGKSPASANTANGVARVVPHLGNHPQRAGRGDILCRPELLRCLVELGDVGPVRPRLEPAGAQLPPAPRLPLVHFGHEGQQAHGHHHHLLPLGLRPRAGHVVHLQEAARISLVLADVPAAGEFPLSIFIWILLFSGLLLTKPALLQLVALSRTKWLRNQQTLGNVIFWLGIFMGPSVLCSLYLIL